MSTSPFTTRPNAASVNSHALTSPIHLSSPELINHISDHSLISPSYPHQNIWRSPPVSDKLVLPSDHKQRRNNYR